MALSYDPGSKKWNVSYEKTDNKIDYSTDNKTTKRIYVATWWGYKNIKAAQVSNTPISPSKGVWVGEMNIDRDATAQSINSALGVQPERSLNGGNLLPGIKNEIAQQDTSLNNSYRDLNTANATTNNLNQVKNTAYDKTVALASNTKGGDYVSQRDTIRNIQGLDDQTKNTLENYYKAFYSTEKLQQWDPSLGAKPPYGEFDSSYYKTQSPAAAQQWESAVANDDIDITQRYGEGGFYLQHYTTQGKPAGLRGNKAETTAAANEYLETPPTDADLQAARTIQLGVDTDTQTDRLLNIPAVASEWEKAKGGDSYWKEQAQEKFLDINKPDEFAALFRLSDRPEDQIVRLNYNANAGYGITELEDALGEAVGEKATVDVKRFGALTQDVLKQTIDEMKKAKAREQEMAMFKGFGAFSEITDINKELSNSILGDSGVGGVLSFMGGGKAQESLEKSLTGLTGVNTNNTVYNWQKWFDETLKTKYSKDYSKFEPLEEKRDVIKAFTSEKTKGKVFDEGKQEFTEDFLNRSGFTTTQDLINFLKKQETEGQTILDTIKGDPGDNAKTVLDPILSTLTKTIKDLDKETDRSFTLNYATDDITNDIKIDAQFARDFIDEYLIPRFNQSKSMNEFVEYLDVRQEEQNPFQTQDIMNAAKLVADVRAESYLDQIKATPGRYFDSNFYFNPTGDKARESAYADQASTVAADWEAAKKGDEYWKSQAYRFGVNIEDKDAFARMHFQVKGQGKGYDPADDILNASKVSDYIYTQILPALKEEALKSGTVFGQFITPEEFADEMLRGLDPNDKSTWDEVLKRYGMDDFKGNIDELKEYVKETLRTGSAQEIRENIKYLNEKRQKPTQEALGVTYIERPEDYKDEGIKGETELYKTFQSAGFKGTEDEFYNDFFPDMDRSEQVLLTKSGKDESLKTTGLDFTDPFASLGTIESFFDADEPEETTDKPEPKTNSYFRIAMGEDEDEPTTKSKSGASILGEFTSMFKGL
jgi:hypothetical protein